MNDLYTELLVKRVTPQSAKIFKGVLIAIIVLTGLAGLLIHPFGFLFFIVFVVFAYFKLPGVDLEFEYLYVNGELDVDKIMSKTRRKRAANYQIEKIEMLVPENSHELDYYKQNSKIKRVDFSSGEKHGNVYAMVYNGEKSQEIVLLELNDIILNDIRRIAPRKVKLS